MRVLLKSIFLCQTSCLDPYENLALEQVLLEYCPEDSCILYLWQNQNTVVIGRNQNPWRECRLELLQQEQGTLARRLSGGGAVFHDVGNLNFTFLTTASSYDLSKQMSVIEHACRSLGIAAELSGRNDILAEGRKFSGNAFYQSQGKAYHHGTLLVDADFDKLQRYLSPSKAKMQAKGVSSVQSRVINLRQLVPSLNCQTMGQAMADAFSQVYDLKPVVLEPARFAGEKLDSLRHKNASWDWLYGTTLPFSIACEQRFDWGELQLQLAVQSGVIQAVKAYTDAMDWQIAGQLETALPGTPFTSEAVAECMCQVFAPESDVGRQIADLLMQQM